MVFTDILTRLLLVGLSTIWVLIVFHAPISVFFGQFIPEYLAKSWKEIILVLLLIPTSILVYKTGIFSKLTKDWLLRLIALYALLHIALVYILQNSTEAKLAGLAIDLRYLLFFVLVYILILIKPDYRRIFLKLGLISVIISIGFAFLQATILPHDSLKYVGYSHETIEPYLTVDKNNDYIRINGTLRGPNPLGAFAGLVLILITAFVFKNRKIAQDNKWFLFAGVLATLTTLWSSYSRSAFLGLVISSVVFVAIYFGKKIKFKALTTAIVSLVFIVCATFVIRDSHFIQNVVLHNNPKSGSAIDSNEAHVDSLESGSSQVLKQPLGSGVGSAGSASLRGDNPMIIENQYLFVAHETGWLGLTLFLSIFFIMMKRLYKNRHDWLSLGLFCSGIGLSLIGILLPVWVDDTVSLVWFGLVAISLASSRKGHLR